METIWLATQLYPHNDWLASNFSYTTTYAHGPHSGLEPISMVTDILAHVSLLDFVFEFLPLTFTIGPVENLKKEKKKKTRARSSLDLECSREIRAVAQ